MNDANRTRNSVLAAADRADDDRLANKCMLMASVVFLATWLLMVVTDDAIPPGVVGVAVVVGWIAAGLMFSAGVYFYLRSRVRSGD
ncbi:hypothetical protein [Luteipulveratus halotolerans]|uniref:Uncharacterized protein n=1 Tax=Luteipulveratus halotolerans TaxID=1631356 RepID=A0A0L6CPI3_9MICO|nr:hypothetical protein [Luteipulveratus halotolerans]KNX39669.1 hypothetical protein VV01_00065 [Luteipulveratus halotolerans]KNX39712.1 hypothetical protein VV01_00320 [Luteipulveratus halotolerans]